MSPASYLTAPPRDAASIVAPRWPRSACRSVRKRFGKPETAHRRRGLEQGDYHAGVATAVWIALAFLLVAVISSLAFVGLRALSLWRAFRSFSRTAETALERVTRAAAAAEASSGSITAKQERLARATEHLQTSLAQLALLRAAAAEANAALARLRGVVPSK